MQRAVDKLITLLTKVCRPVNRRLSVMLEQGDLLLISLIHYSQTSEKIRVAAQQMSKSGYFWNDRESRFSLIVKQRFKNTNSRPIMTEEAKIEWSYRVAKRRNLSCSSRRRTTSTRSTTSSWTIIGTKSGFSWGSREKSQWDGRVEAISRLNIRYYFEEKIVRRSRYYPWTYKQDSGITEWN